MQLNWLDIHSNSGPFDPEDPTFKAQCFSIEDMGSGQICSSTFKFLEMHVFKKSIEANSESSKRDLVTGIKDHVIQYVLKLNTMQSDSLLMDFIARCRGLVLLLGEEPYMCDISAIVCSDITGVIQCIADVLVLQSVIQLLCHLNLCSNHSSNFCVTC